jgi:hypothetical protein
MHARHHREQNPRLNVTTRSAGLMGTRDDIASLRLNTHRWLPDVADRHRVVRVHSNDPVLRRTLRNFVCPSLPGRSGLFIFLKNCHSIQGVSVKFRIAAPAEDATNMAPSLLYPPAAV